MSSPSRVLRAIGTRLRRPLVWRRRLLFDRPLTEDFPAIEPRIPVEWVVRPHPEPPRPGAVADPDPSITLHALHKGIEIYRSEVITDRDYIRHLFPACTVGLRPIYHGDVVTEPAYRGNQLHPAGIVWVFRYYRDRGHDMAFMRVRADNAASLSGMRRAGYRLCGEAYHMALFGFELPPFGRRLRERAGGEPRGHAPDPGFRSAS